MVNNVHHRDLQASPQQVAALMASLSSSDDRLWPRAWWPAMRFDRPLETGAVGGHGPIRYSVEAYEPGECVRFRFSAPRGFNGFHQYEIEPIDEHTTRLRHTLRMTPSPWAWVTWTLVFRPLHDALIEDSLDLAEANLAGREPGPRQWSGWVRLLRDLLRPATLNKKGAPREG